MIGIGAVASGLLAAAVVVALPGDAGPGPRIAADRLVDARAGQAADALAALDDALAPALDAARRGAARIVAGDAAPGPELRDAAALVTASEPSARAAAEALEALGTARRARSPGAEPIEVPLEPAALPSLAGQLTSTAEAGDAFAAMRSRAESVTPSLADALAALDANDLGRAERLTAQAREDHDAVRDWEVDLVTLPVWIGTTDAMIGAMERIVAATRDGDAAAAREAAEDFVALDADAAEADRALRIALSEGGAAVSAPALGRLADAVAAVRQARFALAAMHEAAR